MMNFKYFLTLSMLIVFTACNSSGGKDAVPGGSELSGTVSSVVNFLNPFPSAYASDSICEPVSGNDKVKVYTINPADGSKTLACATHLGSDNSFKATIHDEQIPAGHHLKIEADLGGGVIREAVVSVNDKKSVSVDPSSTLAVPLALDVLKSDEAADIKSVRQRVKSFIEASGVNFSGITPEKINLLKSIFENSLSSVKQCVLEDGVQKDSLKAFISARYRSKVTVDKDGKQNYQGGHNYLKFD